jgi:hypothetical protein
MVIGKLCASFLILGAVYMAFSPGQSKVPLALSQPAALALQRLQTKSRIVNGTGMGSLTIKSGGTENDGIKINVQKAGQPEGLSCVVAIDSVSQTASLANINCEQLQAPEGAKRKIGEEALAIIVREHVAATVDDRDYDINAVSNRMIKLVAMNSGAIAGSISPP